MKKTICFVSAFLMIISLTVVAAFAVTYTAFDIVFEEKEGAKVNGTEIKVFASVDEGELSDRTGDFTLEDVQWFKYLSRPEDGKTAEDYDYVDEELKIYGILCTDEDVFEHDNYSYFLRIARLYAKEEDTFWRNVRINGVDIEEMNGICYNTGSEFFIKTITNGQGGISGDGDVTDAPTASEGDPAEPSEPQKPAGDKCRVCGICPIQPLGICLFIWIAIILVIAVLVIVLILWGKKNDKKENEKNKEKKD